VNDYLSSLKGKDWQKLNVSNTAKGVLKADYHFVRVWIWDKRTHEPERRLLMIRKNRSKKGSIDIKYSFTNANLDQYKPEGLAYMQAERYYIEHSIKESKHILGMDQYQTRKWLAWQHQIAWRSLILNTTNGETISFFYSRLRSIVIIEVSTEIIYVPRS